MGSLHSNKFLNPIRDGAVLPILHLNGYKIANPTISARISPEELHSLFVGFGWTPYLVEGDDPAVMHQQMAATLEECVTRIRSIQADARASGSCERPRWPMIILRTPKGWTAPKDLDGHRLEGSWRAHQIPIPDVVEQPGAPADAGGVDASLPTRRNCSTRRAGLFHTLKALAPTGARRMSANPHANGGVLRIPLRLPDFGAYAVPVTTPGVSRAPATQILGQFLRDVMRDNMGNFRVFGPDETASNRLQAIYDASKKTWLAGYRPEDADGGELAPDGRVMEMLSEHTLEGWAEGYVLTGRHAFFASYEAFFHIIDSMVNQHAKWLEKCKTEVKWRASIPSLNLLVTSTVWRQDHNGFTHQDPGFLDVVTNKSAVVTRIYLPPDANCLLSVADHCLRSVDYVNVIVADKQLHLAVSGYRRGRQALRKGRRDLDVGQHGSKRRTRCRHRERGRCGHGGSAGRNRHSAGEVPGSEDPVRQRGRSVQAPAVDGASARTDRPRLRFRCSRATSRSSSRSTDTPRSFTSSRIAVPTTRTCTSAATKRKAASTRRWG